METALTDGPVIADYKLHRLRLELALPIGDSQVKFTVHWLTVLELITEGGLVGVGFDLRQGKPTPALAELESQFQYNMWPVLRGANPFAEALRITRPRGGNVGAATLPLAVETATWDLIGKAVNLPLYRLFGGTNPEVPAYGSTLDFHLTDDEFRTRLGGFKNMGFQGVKIKVGHPDVYWDLKRMAIAREMMGQDVDLMIDANEAWSPKEAIRRSHIYRNEGFRIFWIEDPITREDYAGYAQLRGAIPFTRINTGEYLGFSGKRRLLEAGGVDVLNIHGSIAMSRSAAHLAGDFGIPVALGNTIMEIGVHLAASLPEVLYLEFSDLAWNRLAKDPIKFADGKAIAPDRPGHGIELDRDALAEYSVPD
jgi:L-alanine-DL-glutamate epimerase-like enolase superfamily enzyme